jgi:ADP-ribosylglycohydrolase
MRLHAAQQDRAQGVLVASAVGDALGAGYEFGSAPFPGTPAMIGGGLGDFAPGEWTDDTAQTIAIAEVAATGADLRDESSLDAIALRFADWYADGPPDIGVQTRAVLTQVGRHVSAASMRVAAKTVHDRTGRSAGNASLMRTAAVALAHLEDPHALVQAAMAVSRLTHHDPLAGESAALWCLMIRHAVLTGEFPAADDVLDFMPHRQRWTDILDDAETHEPDHFCANGWAVGALQAAWSAIVHTPVPSVMPRRHLEHALAAAIGIGNDTDTVAAIAGALLGARWGLSAVPQEWLRQLHGWPGLGSADLARFAALTVRGGQPDRRGWPSADRLNYESTGRDTCVPHPLVDGVHLGGIHALDHLPAAVDAVVSLCRVGRRQVPDGMEHLSVRLLDTEARDNPNVDFAIDDAARAVMQLRAEGRVVFLHCVAAHSRTPTVAARIGVLAGASLSESLDAVVNALPEAEPRRFFVEALSRLDGKPRRSPTSVQTRVPSRAPTGGTGDSG